MICEDLNSDGYLDPEELETIMTHEVSSLLFQLFILDIAYNSTHITLHIIMHNTVCVHLQYIHSVYSYARR